MWRALLYLTFLAALLGAAAAGLHASGGGPSATLWPANCVVPPHSSPGGLPLSCSVPSGGTIDPCSLVTAGVTHCPINLPDLNPADWAAWLLCQIGASAQTVWNDMVSFFDQAVVAIAQGVSNTLGAALGAIVSAIEGVINEVGLIVVNALTGAISSVNSVASNFGPFAPIVSAAIFGGFLVAGVLLAYWTLRAVIALAKTVVAIL